jgi:hypothetical protein
LGFQIYDVRLGLYLPLNKGDSGGKVNVLGVDSIGHCEKEVHVKMSQILDGYRGRAVCIHKYRNIANGNKERKISVN